MASAAIRRGPHSDSQRPPPPSSTQNNRDPELTLFSVISSCLILLFMCASLDTVELCSFSVGVLCSEVSPLLVLHHICWRTIQALPNSLLGSAECTSPVLFSLWLSSCLSYLLVPGSTCCLVLRFIPVARLEWRGMLSCLRAWFCVLDPLVPRWRDPFITRDCRTKMFSTHRFFIYWSIFTKRCFSLPPV